MDKFSPEHVSYENQRNSDETSEISTGSYSYHNYMGVASPKLFGMDHAFCVSELIRRVIHKTKRERVITSQ